MFSLRFKNRKINKHPIVHVCARFEKKTGLFYALNINQLFCIFFGFLQKVSVDKNKLVSILV